MYDYIIWNSRFSNQYQISGKLGEGAGMGDSKIPIKKWTLWSDEMPCSICLVTWVKFVCQFLKMYTEVVLYGNYILKKVSKKIFYK